MIKLPFADTTFINTRPTHQARSLTEQLQTLGATVITYPCLTIKVTPQSTLQKKIDQLPMIHQAIFVSANAVSPIMDCQSSLSSAHIIAIGSGTAKALMPYVQTPITQPSTANSEGILALPSLQFITNQPILIGSGHETKPLLIKTLQQRGALIHHIESYCRQPNHLPSISPSRISPTQKLVIIITSLASFQQFMLNIDPVHRSWLMRQQLLVISDQLSSYATQLGWQTKPWVAKGANSEQLIRAAHKHLQ